MKDEWFGVLKVGQGLELPKFVRVVLIIDKRNRTPVSVD